MDLPARTRLIGERYGSQPRPTAIIWNEQVEHLLGHRCVRAFRPDPLPHGALETMVAAAQSASSSSNLHHWSVIAVSDPGLKQQLDEFTGHTYPFVVAAPVILLWVADGSRNQRIAAQNGHPPAVYDYLDAFAVNLVDTALAAQNAVVAAESIGLGACFLGSLRNRSQELADLVGLPRFSFVAFGLAVGVPDPARAAAIRPRPAQRVVLHHDRYDTARTEGWVEDYESALKEFRTNGGLREKTWVESVLTATGTAYLEGRENLRATVQERGYRLG